MRIFVCPSEGGEGFEWFSRTPSNSDLARFVELFKSFQPEVKASKSVKRFKSYGHLRDRSLFMTKSKEAPGGKQHFTGIISQPTQRADKKFRGPLGIAG